MSYPSTERTDGFTFLEVLLSVFIIGISIMPVIQLLIQNQRQTVMTGSTLVAQNQAGSILNRLRQMPFDDVVSLETMKTERARSIKAMIEGGSVAAMNGAVAVETRNLDRNFKSVRVAITWEEAGTGKTKMKRKVELEALLARSALETRRP
jgi:Tfp pilus assembly protein PilV